MLVGEGPGAHEDKVGRPFVGAAGRNLNDFLETAGLTRQGVYITNVVKCRPPGNRKPEPDEVESCRSYIVGEIDDRQPAVIIALGASAAKALTGKDKVKDNRGKFLSLLPVYRSEIPVLVTYHPAATLHNPGMAQKMKADIVTDLRLAEKYTRNGAQEEDEPPVDDASARVVLKALGRAERLACDGEWEVLKDGGKNPWSKRNGKYPRLICVSVAGEADGQMLTTSVPADGDLMKAVKWLIEHKPTTFHNAAADLVWLASLGIDVNLGGDTLLLASLLNLETSQALGVLAPMLTDTMPGWKEDTKDVMGRWPESEEEWHRLLVRNARDAHATVLLERALITLAHERAREGVLPLYGELLRATSTLARTARHGVPLDVEALREAAGRIKAQAAKAREEVAELLDVPSFATRGSGSNIEVAYALERECGLRFPRTPKTKKPSLKVDYLAGNEHRAALAYSRMTKLEKADNTYLSKWLYLCEQQGDGQLHSVYKLWAARTGRTSVEHDTGGTIQQYPRGPLRKLVRARPGRKIVSADQGQIELRISAWFANEETMLRFIREGIDPHRATAAWVKVAVKGVSLSQYLARQEEFMAEVTPDERQAGKPVNFGYLYGMREKTFVLTAQKDYGVTYTLEQATKVRKGFFTLYPGYAQWHKDAWKWVRLGYVDTPLGRRRPLTQGGNEDAEGLLRKALNTPVQGTASDISLLALPDIEDRFEAAGLSESALVIGFIHDAGLFEIEDTVLDEAVAIIEDEMEHPAALRRLGVVCPVPLEVEAKKSETWS